MKASQPRKCHVGGWKYKTPRPGTISEKIVEALRAYPYRSYAAIAKSLSSHRGRTVSRSQVAAVACTYELKRGDRRLTDELIEKMRDLIVTTNLPYSVIGSMCDGVGRGTVGLIARRFGIHDPNKRNPTKAAAYALREKMRRRSAEFQKSAPILPSDVPRGT